jgi:two-component sensor histidine kinase
MKTLQALDTERSADDMDLILREAHHRIKNTLTLLGAWLHTDFRPSASVHLPEAIDRFERRIIAFGKLYQLLSNVSERRYISMGDYGGALCQALTVAILEPNGLRCEANIGDGFLDTKRCERLGLIIAELVTNAAKHAFADRKAGLVRIEALYHDDCWRCTVKDNGVAPINFRRGVGGQIVADLTRSIGAHVVTESGPDGTTVSVVLPHYP